MIGLKRSRSRPRKNWGEATIHDVEHLQLTENDPKRKAWPSRTRVEGQQVVLATFVFPVGEYASSIKQFVCSSCTYQYQYVSLLLSCSPNVLLLLFLLLRLSLLFLLSVLFISIILSSQLLLLYIFYEGNISFTLVFVRSVFESDFLEMRIY